MFKLSKLFLMAIMVVLFAGGAKMAFAQDPQEEKTAIYEKYLACRKDTDPDKKRACIEFAKQYLAKFSADNDEYVAYLQKQVENFKKWDEDQANQRLFERYNNAVKTAANVNADEAFSAGKEILEKGLLSQFPSDELDVIITLATIGLDKYQAAPTSVKFNADALNFAKLALQKMNAGVVSKNFGNFGYACTTKANKDGKSNCLGYMNFTVGYFMYYWQGQKKDALSYFYKAAQYNTAAKTEPALYGSMADWYFSELVKLNQFSVDKVKVRDERLKARDERLKASNGAVNDEIKRLDAEIKSLNDEVIQLIAMQRGYADRALHAYALDYNVESTAPANQTFRDSLKAKMQQLYEFRFEGKKEGLDEYIAASPGRAMADPSTTVAPIAETPPAQPSGGATATTATPTSTAPSTVTATKPANGASTTTTAAKPSTTATTTKSTKTTKKVVSTTKKPVRKPRR